MDKTVLVVNRDDPHDIKMRDLLLFIDGTEVANLAYGDHYEAEIAPGPHTVAVSNRLFTKSASFDLEEGHEADFSASNEMRGLGLIMLEVFGVGPYRAKITRIDN
jgi:hypothetical protein